VVLVVEERVKKWWWMSDGARGGMAIEESGFIGLYFFL